MWRSRVTIWKGVYNKDFGIGKYQRHDFFLMILLASVCLYVIFNRLGVAGAVLQTLLYLILCFGCPFPPNLQNIIAPKLLKLWT